MNKAAVCLAVKKKNRKHSMHRFKQQEQYQQQSEKPTLKTLSYLLAHTTHSLIRPVGRKGRIFFVVCMKVQYGGGKMHYSSLLFLPLIAMTIHDFLYRASE